MTVRTFIQRGGLWVASQNVLTVAVIGLAPVLRGPRMRADTAIIGLGLLGLGGWLGIGGVRALGRNRTAYPEPKPDSTFVQSGVYGLVRHPLYASLMFASTGWALLWASWPGLVAAGLLTLLLQAKAIREEGRLRERYPRYRGYERQVKRFVPWLW